MCVTDIRSTQKGGGSKVFLCHAPNGNPSNVQLLSVSINAIPSHLGFHPGDRLGNCNTNLCASSRSATEEPSAIDLPEEGLKVEVYPNPSNDVFSVIIQSLEEINNTISVYDILGKRVELITNAESFTTYQVGKNLPIGNYNIVVQQGANYETIRVVKSH